MSINSNQKNLFITISVLVIALIVGGLTSANLTISLIFVLLLIITAIITNSPVVIALCAFFIIFTNAVVIANKFHGLPFITGAIIPIILLGVFIAYKVIILKKTLVFDVTILLFLAYFAIGIFGAVASIDPITGFNNLFVLATEGIFLYLLILNTIRSPNELRQFIWAILFGAIFISGISVYQQATETFDNNYWGFAQVTGRGFGTGETTLSGDVIQARLGGPLGEKNYFAQLMLMIVPIGLNQFLSESNNTWKFLALLATGLAITTTALTYSRGGAVAFLILVIVMISFGYIRFNQVVFVGIGIFLIFIFNPQYSVRLLTIQDVFNIRTDGPSLSNTDLATQGRIGEMYTAWLVFLDHPLIGVGPDMFKFHYQEYADLNGIKTHPENRRAHNIFLEIAANNGLIGFISFFAIPGLTLFKLSQVINLWRKKDPALAYIAMGIFLAITSYLANGLFLSLAYERYFWFILAIGGAIVLISKDQEKVSTKSAITA